MKNLEAKMQILRNDFNAEDCITEGNTLREYVECVASSDPGFFRWLFGEEFEEDFSASLSDEQINEYEGWLNTL